MLDQFKKCLALVDRSIVWQAGGIGALVLFGVVLEAVGIGLIFPIIKLIANPSQVHEMIYVRDLVGTVLPAGEREAVIALTLGLLGVFVFKNAFLFVVVYVQAWFSCVNMQLLSLRLFARYLYGPYALHLSRNSADLINNILGACNAVFSNGFMGFVTLFSELLLMAGIAAVLLIAEPLLTLVVMVTIGVCIAAFYLVFRHRLAYWGERTLEVNKLLLKILQQGFHSIKEAKVLGREDFIHESYKKPRTEFRRLILIKNLVANTPRLGVETLMITGMLAAVLYILIAGGSSGKALATLTLFAAAAFRLIPSMNRVLISLARIQDSQHAIEVVYRDIREIPDVAPSQSPGNISALPFREILKVENLSFTYAGVDRPTLKNIDLSIQPGESIGLVGPSGAGKTTLVDIILGLLTPTSGRVLVDGADIEADTAAWQCQLGYVPQSIYLLDDTLRRNIAFGINDREIDENKVLNAVRLAQLDDMANDLPEGLDTNVGEHGVRLSGGQRQRVGIARALYRDPAVIVLDEATSALDSETESEFNKAIERLSGTKTLIIIAHRLSTVRKCDRVIFLRDGVIVQTDTFEKLAAEIPEFSQLVELSRL